MEGEAMTKKLTNQKIRNSLREKGIPVKRTILGARFLCRARYWRHAGPQWVFAEVYGFVILDLVTIDLYNHARMKNGMKKLRIRDMDKMAVFRHPRKAWMYNKSKKK